jgi:membrane fusion protein (multidrug efflux system)
MAVASTDRAVNVREKISHRKLIRWAIVVLVIAAAAIFGWRYWRTSQLSVGTDDAYINAHRVDVAAQVSGPVTRVFISENQAVKAGQPLFDIDPRPFELALARAQAQLQLATQSVSQQSAAVSAAEAQVVQRRAELRNAQDNDARTRQLMSRGFLSAQGGETARTQLATARAALDAALANLEQARSALGKTGSDNASVQAATAAVEQAKLDLEHTHVLAPHDGVVSNLTLRPGDVVQPGAPLFVVINNQEYWVDANFKETELKRIRSGERATIEVDMYPGRVFHGVVESLSGGSGTAFSLLPPQNATGNWVKVTQRVPVRVRVIDPDPRYPLRIGTTATVKVDVRNA